MEEKNYVLTLLHFNLEFVAGEYNTYDKLLNEAFEPALDVFLEHPQWHADIELSGMQLEYMETHFPWMVEKLRKLNGRKQIDVICVHYSETIWPAFPLKDFEKSWEIDREIMDRLGLKFSGTFFAQENFFGEGLAAVKDKFGIRNAVIPEKNYFWPYNRLTPLYPVYSMNGLNLVIRGDMKHEKYEGYDWWVYEDKEKDLKIRWRYDKCGDGEPWVGGDPYENFWRDEEKIEGKRRLYSKGQELGWKFLTTDEFVHEMESLGIEKPKLKPIPDGPWGLKKPGVYQWMGFYFSFYELDVEMRSLGYRSRNMLLATEALINQIERKILKEKDKGVLIERGKDLDWYKKMLERAWHLQINCEVSDSSGWVPTLPEMFYSIDKALTAFYWGEKMVKELSNFLKKNGIEGTNVVTDPSREEYGLSSKINQHRRETGYFTEIGDLPEAIKAQFLGPEQKIKFYKRMVDVGGEEYLIEFSFLHMDLQCGVKFDFMDNEALRYSPALMDDTIVAHPLDDFNKECTYLYLPLPNGLINIAPDWWVIKHNDSTHVSCKIDFENKKLEFISELNMMALGGREELGLEIYNHWRFTLFHGPEKYAIKIAREINLYPTIPLSYALWERSGDEPFPWIPFTRMVSK